MPAFQVAKSIVVDSSVRAVFSEVRNFERWSLWSPWLVSEPDCQLVYLPEGEGYTWDGKIVGAGEMKAVGEEQDRSIDYALTFLKPWKSTADVRREFSEVVTARR